MRGSVIRSVAQRVEDLQRHLGDEPVGVVVQVQPGDLLDPLDPVGHRVGVHVQDAGGPLRAVVLPEVAGQRGQVLRLVLLLVQAELAQHVGGEGPQLGQVGHLQQQPEDAQVAEGRDAAGPAEPRRVWVVRCAWA